MQDFLLWTLGLTFLVIGLLRFFSKSRHASTNRKAKRSIYYCNVCVNYFKNPQEPKQTPCPKCNRPARRGIRN